MTSVRLVTVARVDPVVAVMLLSAPNIYHSLHDHPDKLLAAAFLSKVSSVAKEQDPDGVGACGAYPRGMSPRLRCLPIALASLAAPTLCDVAFTEAGGRSLYELAVETSMPHLEENLRYTKTIATECLNESELLVAFPVLTDNAFRGCKLSETTLADTYASYRLTCPASTGTTGRAKWQRNASQLHGMLVIKLGGKNMTFSQRVTARRAGKCESLE